MPILPLPHFRSWMTANKETAERICGRELFVLGEGPREFGNRVDWEYGVKRDIKIPWELSRFQFLSTLCRAYEIHHDEKYAEAARELIEDWIARNRRGRGIHWRVAMEVAIRACNWALAWEFLKDSPSWKQDGFRKNFLESLEQHGDFITTNLENKKSFTTNHYLADLAGICFLGTLFPEFPKAAEWKTFGFSELERELMRQTYEDGVFYEASIPYHRLACEIFGFCTLLGKENDVPFTEEFLTRLEHMFSFARAYTKSNGLAPQIGDGDDGRLFIFEDYFNWEPRDHRHLFRLHDALFLMNKKSIQENDSARSLPSRGFEKGGIYILRTNDWYCAVDCGPNGQNGNGGHCHNDTLSFEFSAGGQDFIIDPGTFVYTGNPPERRRFRGTRMHNTVMVDEKEQNRFRLFRLFGVKNDCTPKINRWELGKEMEILDAQHSAYERLSSPITHRRTFYHANMLPWRFEITDTFTGKSRHELEWNFHFSPHTKISMKNKHTYLLDKNGVQLTLEIPPELQPRAYIRWDFVSPRYGVKIEAPVLTIKKTTTPHEDSFRFTILPA